HSSCVPLEDADLAGVPRRPRPPLYPGEDRGKAPRVEIALLPLQNRRDALEAHAGIDVLRRQRRQLLVGAAVELDEDEVPDLDHVRRPRVDQLAATLARRAVDVDLAARAAGAGVAHLPEVVLLVAPVDVRRAAARLSFP